MMTFGRDGAAACVVVVPPRGGVAASLKLGVNRTGAPTARRVDPAGGDGNTSILASGRGFGSGSGLGGTAAM